MGKKDYTKNDLIIFGSLTQAEKKAYKKMGFDSVQDQSRPPFDTGLGPCGKFICSCESSCELNQKTNHAKVY